MYLALLSEKEKEAFLGFAFHLVAVDGNYSDEEKAVINGYCQEMQCFFDEKTMVRPLDALIRDVKVNCDEKIKKIFVFELIGLAMADKNYDDKERALINNLQAEFDIVPEYARNCEALINEYIAFQTKMNQLILE